MAMGEHRAPPHFDGPHSEQSSCSVPTWSILSCRGRAMLIRAFDSGCHFPSREQKDTLLRELQKTDPGYPLSKLVSWFNNRRKFLLESQREQKSGNEVALKTLLDPTTGLAREMWPSLSADILHRLHNMLLEQPNLTVQHKDILASHFGVERKHVENFLNWRVACLHSHVWQEDLKQDLKPLSPTVKDGDAMDVDELLDSRPHLPTPAGSTSPEPVHSRTPFIDTQMQRRPSIDSTPSTSEEHGSGCPPGPGSMINSNLQSSPPHSHTSLNPVPSEANSPTVANPPSPPHKQLSSAKPTQLSPPSPSALPDVLPGAGRMMSGTGHEDMTGAVSSAAMPVKPPPGRIPRTLREFEEAYAPTFARIEHFLQKVECGKCAHVGLIAEMLKETKP